MTRPTAKPQVTALLFVSTFALAATGAHAIELIVHPSTVVKALKAQVFKEKARYYLQRPDGCSDPYLEDPTVSFKDGRIFIGARFGGKIGALIGGVCNTVAGASAVMLSAKPVALSHEVALEDVRLEAADNPIVAAAVQTMFGGKSGSGLRVDLLEAIRPLLVPAKTAPYIFGVRELTVSNLAVQNETLRVSVEATVEIR